MKTENNNWLPSGGTTEIFTLITLYCFGFIFGAFAIKAFLGSEALDNVYNIRGANIIQAIFIFVLPTAIYASLFADNKGLFLIKEPIKISTLLLSVLAILSILPLVETVSYYNELIPLPEDIQASVKEALEANQKAYAILFEEKTAINICANILTIALLPGIVEELFFRGCLQRSVIRATKNPHVGVWVAAFIFSFLHFQITGFFPRILLGALLGYLYLWTKNIWVPIIVHTVNNATVILVMQLLADNETYKEMQITDYSLSNAWPATLISLLLTLGISYFVYKLSTKSKEIS